MKAILAMLLPTAACSEQKGKGKPSDEDAALKHKFHGIEGGELVIDATYETKGKSIVIRGDGSYFPGGYGQYARGAGTVVGFFGDEKDGGKFPLPKVLRMLRYPEDATPNPRWLNPSENERPLPYFGDPTVDIKVLVAERIPEDLLADLRRDPKGNLRLKLRLTPDTLLIGWDIQRRPGFDPNKKDKWGEIVYVGPVHSFAGGDFREAEIFNGQVVRKGWYIDAKTKQRIETNF